jgi:hypothetical protein
MKLTKKTFAPNIVVKVIDNPYSYMGMPQTDFSTYAVSNISELDIKDDTPTIVQPIGTELTTIKMVNYGGSPRVIFKDNNGQVYQAFWIDFSKFVVTK